MAKSRASTNSDKANSASVKLEMMRYLKESLETASRLTLSETPEDVAIFIGTTKSGKSTLLNSLLGNELIGQKEPTLRNITIVKANDSLGPEIGRGPTSETIYPSRWVSTEKLRGLVLWDSPGFEDNRGPIQDIINAYYVYRLFNNINSAKIVLVTDVNDILNDRINPFLSLLTSLENLFRDKLSNCFYNIIVAFTKVPSTLDDEPVDSSFISSVLNHQILSTDGINMSESTRNFIRHLTGNHNQICLFGKAKVGPIPSNADAEVVRGIQSIRGVQRDILQTVSPSIAPASKNFLFEVRHELTSTDSFSELETSIKAAFKKKLSELKNNIEQEQSQENIKLIKAELICLKNKTQTIIVADTSFHNKIENLQNIDDQFRDKIQGKDLLEKSRMMEFIDGVLGLKDSHIYNVNLRSIMENAKSEINELIVEVQLKLHEIDRKVADEEINRIREEEKKNRKKAEEERKQYEKENKETEERFFTNLGKKTGEVIDDMCDKFAEFRDKIKFW